MKIVRLEIKNFEGYRSASVRFTDGLNIIVGRNSVGKTTILDAILYGLYGSVPGVEKRLLSSRRGAGGLTRVLLEFEASGKRVEVVREGRVMGDSFRTERVHLTVDGKPVGVNGEADLNRSIVELTGVGPKSFCVLIYARQGELTRILEPSRDEMDMALRISLMREVNEQLEEAARELERYEGRDAKTLLEAAQERVKQLEASLAEYRRHLASVELEVKGLEEALGKAASDEVRMLLKAIRDREEAERRFEAEGTVLSSILSQRGCGNIDELRAMVNSVASEHADAYSKLEALRSEEKILTGEVEAMKMRVTAVKALLNNIGVSSIRDLEGAINAIKCEMEAAEREYITLKSSHELLEERAARERGLLSTARREIEEYRRLIEEGASKCPTCGQDVSPERLADLIRVKEAEAEGAKRELAVLEAELNSVKERLNHLGARITELKVKMRGLEEVKAKVFERLQGYTLEDAEARTTDLEVRLNEVKCLREEAQKKVAELEAKKSDLEGALREAERRLNFMNVLEANIKGLSGEVARLLSALNLPFNASDPDLKAKLAGVIPISPEVAEEKRRELEAKRRMRGELESKVKAAESEIMEKKRLIEVVSKRLEAARRARKIIEAIKAGIEGYRRRRLRAIADEALKIFLSLTDQRVYDAFRIREDDYTVEVHQPGLSDYIPARRVGGGHQTLIALAVRIAMLGVMGCRSLLILDEPTYGVDSENLPQLMAFISEAAKKLGQTILVTHHELGLEEAANIIRVSLDREGYSRAEQAA